MWQPQEPTLEPPQSPPGAHVDAGASARRRNPGRRFAQVVRLRPERVAEYKACHARIWPEVAKQIKDCGLEDYSIWFDDKSSLLFASFKYIGYDYAGDMQRMAENPKVREWWKMTDSFQESLVEGATSSEAGEPGWWKPMEEVFYQA
ncbi:l-rhamnose mutarotase domain-containing protein [Hirsutella rhossiliensis]|uniref:L-rhamnose mutarotase domain-containing protein n=1 Tax=Hirsutella rhossiliensis TaxID=111463 RepID=A0A9P8SKG0_9HYPO|nr:l-rhamnose mutarotase domain-containing protein [Hirsutella rhossiliensis]KAH0964101.1 l-rhamnose mutarotase domain-containing protein [Hirsutella rhossiliensis]